MEGEEVGEGKVIGARRGKRRSRRHSSLMSRDCLAHHVDSEI